MYAMDVMVNVGIKICQAKATYASPDVGVIILRKYR